MGLWVSEGDPNFGDLVGGEILGDVIDMGSQESNIAEVFGNRSLGARPHAVAFDVHAHVIDIGVEAGQTHGIIAFSAGQLYHNGIVVAEKGVPVSFRFLGILKIERVRKLVVLGKFDEFGFAHGAQRYCDLAICPKNINFGVRVRFYNALYFNITITCFVERLSHKLNLSHLGKQNFEVRTWIYVICVFLCQNIMYEL